MTTQSLSLSLLLQQTVALYREHRWNYLGYSAWLFVPIVGIILANVFENILLVAGLFIFGVMKFMLMLWIMVILIRMTFAFIHKQTLDQKTLAWESVKLLMPVFIVGSLYALVTLGGLLLLIVPGILFGFWYVFAPLTVILDEKRPLEALSASRELVRGRFASVAWVIICEQLLLGLLSMMILVIVATPIVVFAQFDPIALLTPPTPLWFTILQEMIEILIFPFSAIFATVVFVELKKPKKQDGLDETCTIA